MTKQLQFVLGVSLLLTSDLWAQSAPATATAAQAASRPHRDVSLSSVLRVPEASVHFIASKEEKAVAGGFGGGIGESFSYDVRLKGPLDEGAPVPFGAYKNKDREIVTGVVRKWISTFAMDLRVSYDFNNDAKSIEFPFQFVSLDGKGVTAGIAAGWTSEPEAKHDGWSVRAFVGDVLSVWPTKH